jgi:hypothetical protein
MTRFILPIILCAGFVMLFGLLPHRQCTGHCPGCSGSCGRYKEEGDHHAG